jgi:NAD+ synthase
MEELSRKLTEWIRERVLEANCRGAVFGLSGGVDSAVVAVLCRRAFPDNVLGVLMPCHSDPADAADASTLADNFAIPTVAVVLDGVYDALLKALPPRECEPDTQRRAEANIKPRLRMTTLYYFANRLHYLVAGTSNKSELSVGYFSKHGDAGVDMLPLGNLPKSRVRELAKHFQIPARIIDKPPSAGLWEGQTDEAEMGISYAELDRYLDTGDAPAHVRSRIDAMVRTSAHKILPLPIPPF